MADLFKDLAQALRSKPSSAFSSSGSDHAIIQYVSDTIPAPDTRHTVEARTVANIQFSGLPAHDSILILNCKNGDKIAFGITNGGTFGGFGVTEAKAKIEVDVTGLAAADLPAIFAAQLKQFSFVNAFAKSGALYSLDVNNDALEWDSHASISTGSGSVTIPFPLLPYGYRRGDIYKNCKYYRIVDAWIDGRDDHNLNVTLMLKLDLQALAVDADSVAFPDDLSTDGYSIDYPYFQDSEAITWEFEVVDVGSYVKGTSGLPHPTRSNALLVSERMVKEGGTGRVTRTYKEVGEVSEQSKTGYQVAYESAVNLPGVKSSLELTFLEKDTIIFEDEVGYLQVGSEIIYLHDTEGIGIPGVGPVISWAGTTNPKNVDQIMTALIEAIRDGTIADTDFTLTGTEGISDDVTVEMTIWVDGDGEYNYTLRFEALTDGETLNGTAVDIHTTPAGVTGVLAGGEDSPGGSPIVTLSLEVDMESFTPPTKGATCPIDGTNRSGGTTTALDFSELVLIKPPEFSPENLVYGVMTALYGRLPGYEFVTDREDSRYGSVQDHVQRIDSTAAIPVMGSNEGNVYVIDSRSTDENSCSKTAQWTTVEMSVSATSPPYHHTCIRRGNRYDQESGELKPTSEFVVPTDNVPFAIFSLNSLGKYAIDTPLNCHFSLIQIVEIGPFTTRSYDTYQNFTWPAVLNNVEMMNWTRRDGGIDTYPMPVWTRYAYSGPCKATITETWSNSEITLPTVERMIPLPVAYSCPAFRISIGPSLHDEGEFSCDFGTNHSVYENNLGSSRTFPATNYLDWPANILVSATQTPYRGGYLLRTIRVYQPVDTVPSP